MRVAAVSPRGNLQLRQVDARWTAGGTGYPGGVETPGVLLHVWDHDNYWREVAINDAPADAPALVEWSTSDAALLGRLLAGPLLELTTGVTSAPNGNGVAEVASSYAEVTVKYRRAP